MRVGPLSAGSTFALDPAADAKKAEKTADPSAIDGKPALDPEKLRLAQEFEQIFIRKMLSSLEKSGQSQEGGAPRAGGSAYGSMVVSALAEAVSKGGGVGLAEVIARAASQPLASGPSASAGQSAAIQSAIAGRAVPQPPTSATYPRPAPIKIINKSNDLQDSFKDPNR